ncbi:MAG: hypothetical protein Q7J57_16720 [Gemmobacter sp.]|nr:hypothetical protein [Gemmobacter sp.]
MTRPLVSSAFVVTALSLAACAGPQVEVRPVAAEIIRAVLVVHMADGQRCVALAPFTQGTGDFGNCPDMTWQVTADPNANPLRRIVESGLALIASDDLLYPMALIEVTGRDGHVSRFVLPPSGPRR